MSRTIATLFPHRADWTTTAADGAMAEWAELKRTRRYFKTEDLLDQELLLGMALRPEQVMGLLREGHFFNYLYRSESWWIDWVEMTGAAAAPVLAFFHAQHPSHSYHAALTRIVGLVVSEETIASSASRLGDWGKLPRAEVAFLSRWPELAIPA